MPLGTPHGWLAFTIKPYGDRPMPREMIEPHTGDKRYVTFGVERRASLRVGRLMLAARCQPTVGRKPRPSLRRARVTAATGAPISLSDLPATPDATFCEYRHRGLARRLIAVRRRSMRRPFSVGQPAFSRQSVAHCLIRTVVSALPNGSSIKCSQGRCSQFPVQFGTRFGIK